MIVSQSVVFNNQTLSNFIGTLNTTNKLNLEIIGHEKSIKITIPHLDVTIEASNSPHKFFEYGFS
jgi:hypothetical protein